MLIDLPFPQMGCNFLSATHDSFTASYNRSLMCLLVLSEKFVVVVTRNEEQQSCTLSLVLGSGRVTCQYLVHGKVNKVCLVLMMMGARAQYRSEGVYSITSIA